MHISTSSCFVKPLNIFYLYQFEALVPQAPDVIYSSHNKKKYHQPNNTQDTHQRHLRFKTVKSAESFAWYLSKKYSAFIFVFQSQARSIKGKGAALCLLLSRTLAQQRIFLNFTYKNVIYFWSPSPNFFGTMWNIRWWK